MEINILSLGAGVQSSAMALMAARGELTPMPECAIFADTQSEPAEVYKWLDWLENQLPFQVHRVSKGNLGEDACRVRTSKKGKNYTQHAVPAFIKDVDGKVGLAMRQCTTDHKIEVIYREMKSIVGKNTVRQWIGISVDEATRMKPSRRAWVTNYYPLVDGGITRKGCLEWMKKNGYPAPPRSACVFCPYHNDSEWKRLREQDPESFKAAIEFEKKYQSSLAQVSGFRGKPFLHRSCVPLEQVDFRSKDERTGQLNFFENECEGMCGV